ncbi:MAG: cupredoxin domain-containing protein [Gaiellales bacterium]
MRKLLVGAAVVAALALASLGLAAGAAEIQVSLVGSGFQPETSPVNWGDTVVFKNNDSTKHTLLIPRLDLTKDLNPGESFSQIFDKEDGSYQIRDRHSNRTYNGRLEVTVSGTLALKGPQTLQSGKGLVLTGTSPYPQAPVSIETRPPGRGGDWAQVTTVTPAGDGSFSVSIPFEKGGRIQATTAAGQLRSETLLVSVIPRLTISVTPRRPKDGKPAKISVKVSPVGAARTATLESYLTLRKRWVKVKVTPVSATTGVVAFSVKATKAPTQYRVSIPRSAVNPGFVTFISKPFKITGS